MADMAFVQVLNFRQPAWNLQDLLEQREREAGLILRVTARPRAERGSSEGLNRWLVGRVIDGERTF